MAEAIQGLRGRDAHAIRQNLSCADGDPGRLPHRLLLTTLLGLRQLATCKRTPKSSEVNDYVDGGLARSHVSTNRVLDAAAQGR